MAEPTNPDTAPELRCPASRAFVGGALSCGYNWCLLPKTGTVVSLARLPLCYSLKETVV